MVDGGFGPRLGPPFDYSHFVPYAQGPWACFSKRIWGLNKNTKCFYLSPKFFPLTERSRLPELRERSDQSRRGGPDRGPHSPSTVNHQTSNMFHLRKRIKNINRAGVLFFAFVAFSKLWAFFEELSVLSIFE